MTDRTPNLNMPYLKPSQAQPEVPVNECLDILDAFSATVGSGGGGGGSGGADSDNSGLTAIVVEEIGGASPGKAVSTTKLRISGATVETDPDGHSALIIITPASSLEVVEVGGASPGETITGVTQLRVSGATVYPESGGVALLSIPTPTIEVEEIGGVSPGEIVQATHLRFCGATVLPESNGVARITIQPPPLRGTWVNAFGAILVPNFDIPIFITEPCTIKEITALTCNGPGSCTIGVWKAALAAHYPPVVGDDITGGNNVVLSSVSTYDDATLTGWSKSLNAGDVLMLHLAASTTFTLISVTIRVG